MTSTGHGPRTIARSASGRRTSPTGHRSAVTGQRSPFRVPKAVIRRSSAHLPPGTGQRPAVTGQGLHVRSTSQSRSFSGGHRSPVYGTMTTQDDFHRSWSTHHCSVSIWQTDLFLPVTDRRSPVSGHRSPVTGQGSKAVLRRFSAPLPPVTGQQSEAYLCARRLNRGHFRAVSGHRSFSRSPVTCLRDYDHSRLK
jgi:hypothetical protein